MKTFLLHVSRQLIRYRLDGALIALFISTALAAICQANQPSNGLPPRPFYVTGHNPNWRWGSYSACESSFPRQLAYLLDYGESSEAMSG